ncbi:MAG TPA: AraC family transcriptional regulator [Polyangiaceae bacterium]
MDETPTRASFEIRGHLHMAADLPRRWIVVPPSDRARALAHPLLEALLPSHVGFFPGARRHRVDRPEGVDQAIFKYCVAGEGWCQVGGRRFDVGAGDLMVVPAEAPHAYASSPDRPWTVHWFHAVGRALPLLARELGVSARQPVVRLGQDARLVALFQELEGALEDDCAFPELLYASQVLAHVMGRMIRLRRAPQGEDPGPRERVRRSAEHMKDRLDRPPAVAELASLAGLSASHYASLFRHLLGCAPKTYFERLRLHKAAGLLLTTGDSVKAIAGKMGYRDALYFSRTFRRVHGVSPSEYRRDHAGEAEPD